MLRTLFAEERGSQTIEFVMIVPAVLLLIMCLGEFGKAAWYKLALQSAVRDGAHLAALQAQPGEMEDVVRRAAGSVPVQSVQITQAADNEIVVTVDSILELKVLHNLGLSDALSHLRIQAESRVPLLRAKHDRS